MPTVPRYTQQVSSQGLPNVNVGGGPAPKFGGGGQALHESINLAKQSQDIFREEKKKADDVATTEAYNSLLKTKQDLIWNPTTGATTRKGKDAFGAVDEYTTKYDQYADDIEGTLNNADQRLMFQQMRAKERLDLEGSLQKHEFRERQVFDDETTKSTLASTQEEAILNYKEPGKIKESLLTQEAIIRSKGDRDGLDDAVINTQVQGLKSQTHSQVISRMLANGEDMVASEYYKNNKDQFTGADAVVIEKTLEEGSTLGESQRQSDKIILKGLPLGESLAEAKKIKDPKVRDMTVNRVKDEFTLKKAAEEQAKEQIYLDATNQVEHSKTTDTIPREQWGQLPLNERSALESYAKNLKLGIQPEDFSQEYVDLNYMASNESTKDEFLKTNLNMYRDRISKSDLQKLLTMQTDIKKGNMKQLTGVRTQSQVVDGGLNVIGLNPKSKNESDIQKIYIYRRTVDEQVEEFQSQNKREPNNQELQEIVDKLTQKVIVEKRRFWSDKTKRVFELEPGETVQDIDIEDVPKNKAAEIKNYLKSKGAPTTDAAVTEFYKAMISRGL